MKTKITIGELSKLYNISAQTLRFYDKADLFKPIHVNENNGYRYYGIEQFALLDVIIFLRELGLSIDEIKGYTNKRHLDSFLSLLEQKKQLLETEINRLRQRKDSIEEKITLINQYKCIDAEGQFAVKNYNKRKIIHISMDKDMDKTKFEYGLKELSSFIQDEAILFRAVIALTIDKKCLEEQKYNQWKQLAFIFENNVHLNKECDNLQEGLYAAISYYGSYDKGYNHYLKLLNWIDNNGFEIVGDGIVLNITEAAFCEREEEYITEIQIPVKKLLTL